MEKIRSQDRHQVVHRHIVADLHLAPHRLIERRTDENAGRSEIDWHESEAREDVVGQLIAPHPTVAEVGRGPSRNPYRVRSEVQRGIGGPARERLEVRPQGDRSEIAAHDDSPGNRHDGKPRYPRPLTEGPRRAPSRFPEIGPSPAGEGRSRGRHDDETRILVDSKRDVVEWSDNQWERDENEERCHDAIRQVEGIVAGRPARAGREESEQEQADEGGGGATPFAFGGCATPNRARAPPPPPFPPRGVCFWGSPSLLVG